jgi:hypothetical protein
MLDLAQGGCSNEGLFGAFASADKAQTPIDRHGHLQNAALVCVRLANVDMVAGHVIVRATTLTGMIPDEEEE